MFTLSALKDSLIQSSTSRTPYPLDLAPDGAIGESGFRRMVQRDGQGAVFALSENIEANDLGKFTALRAPLNRSILKFSYIRDIMEFCDSHGIALVFIIPPAHVTDLQMINHAGIWNVYELWLRSLTRLVAAHRATQIPLWDFSGISPYTTEPAPARDSKITQTVWFWDILHFKRKLGDLLLSRLLTGQTPDVGFLLTPQNVEKRACQGACGSRLRPSIQRWWPSRRSLHAFLIAIKVLACGGRRQSSLFVRMDKAKLDWGALPWPISDTRMLTFWTNLLLVSLEYSRIKFGHIRRA